MENSILESILGLEDITDTLINNKVDGYLDPEVESFIGMESGFFNKIFYRPDVEIDPMGDIRISNLNWQKLAERIKGLYTEKNMFRLFDIIYNTRDTELYNERKIKRDRMRIQGIKTEQFFALEAKLIFDALYDKYGLSYYKSISDQLYENTWLSKTYLNRTKINLDHLKELKFTLKDYQLKFVKDYPSLKDEYHLDGCLLSFDQGLGKTLTATATTLALGCDFVVIVCPNSLKGNWAQELHDYFWKYQEDEQVFHDEVYAIRESKHKFNKEKIKYLIINHESVDATIPYLPEGRTKTAIIVDESHYFRSMEASRSMQLVRLKRNIKSTNNLMMSGTPIKALPNEMVPVMMMIDPMFTDKVAEKYTKMFNVTDLNTADIVKRRFNRFMYRRTKEQVLKLPELEFHDILLKINNGTKYTVKATAEVVKTEFNNILNQEMKVYEDYKRTYKRLLEHYQNEFHRASAEDYQKYISYLQTLDKGLDPTLKFHELDIADCENFTKRFIIPFIKDPATRKEFEWYETRYLRIRQSALGRAIGSVLIPYRSEAYFRIWDEHRNTFIDSINKNPKKTIIFTTLVPVAKYISNSLKDAKIDHVLIIGETENRTEQIARFKYDDNCDVLIATAQTLATGYTLTMADQMYFFGIPFRRSDYDQCVARIHRLGQTTTCHIYNVFLDTGDAPNVTTRMKEIMEWSGNMFDGFITVEEQNK